MYEEVESAENMTQWEVLNGMRKVAVLAQFNWTHKWKYN